MSRARRRSAGALLVVALVGGGVAQVAMGAEPAVRSEPVRGATGLGDPYFPLDGNGGIDVLRYRIHDTYRFGDQHLHGRTRITLRATEDLSSFDLDFLLPVSRVTVDGREARAHKSLKHELVVRPEAPLVAGRRVDVVVEYAGFPGHYAYRGESNWLADDREVVAMNQPHMAPWWFPANDHPQDKALMDITVTVPRGKRVIANGRPVSRRQHGDLTMYHWRADEPMVPYLAFFAAGRFAVSRGTHDGLPWLVAVSKQLSDPEEQLSMRLLETTPDLVHWLAGQLGEYPFGQTGGLVTSLSPGFALENQTRPTYPALNRGATSLLVHELAHQWFGDSVAVHLWRDIWLNEGFATFMQVRYDETHGGRDAQAWLEDQWGGIGDGSFWELQIDDPGASDIFGPAVYTRGAMALQALRHRVGETDFWTILRTWAHDHAGGNGSSEEFHALAEQVSGEDLDGLFDAWLSTGTRPAHTPDNGF